MVYYGLVYNLSNMSGNEFVNFFLMSITELPANFIAWYTAQVFGRRWSAVGFFVVNTFLAFLTAIIPCRFQSHVYFTMQMNTYCPSATWGVAMTTILVSCKGIINGSFLINYIQMAEIFPTSHRASGNGLCSIGASIIGISAPYIAYSVGRMHLVCINGYIYMGFFSEHLLVQAPICYPSITKRYRRAYYGVSSRDVGS